MTGFLVGLMVVPLVLILVALVTFATGLGGSYTCHCGYSTGPMDQAAVITHTRWRWHRASHRTHRAWCFLVHRWWALMVPDRTAYRCIRCGEKWSRP